MDFIRALDDPMSVEQYGQILPTIAWIAVMVLIFYFLLIRPQRKRDKAEKEMRSSIAPGDEISTIGGIVGKVISVKDDGTMIIETGADRTKLKMYTWAIRGKENAAAKPEKSEGKELESKDAPAEKKQEKPDQEK